ncbi:hypothetical protein SAMN05216410_0610 [Sanguibacter gelidistatuariae]|uniref:Uncharacterized protein n=2 Tax=Sanguibacter gelidistatuariae TaxID=1814289 RepID=A0A1G6H289_9MICO|nr:hypothetical protein SAMN05216410_0610 [Sanguibacter gelidistatuariae]
MCTSLAQAPRLARDIFAIFTRSTPSMGDHSGPFRQTRRMTLLRRPDRQTSRRARLAASAVVVLGALTLSACSNLPDVSISTEQLKQLASDAKSQVQTIAGDAKALGTQLSTLPATLQSKATEAAAAAKSAAEQAQTALEDAQEKGADAKQKLADAQTALDDASKKLKDLTSAAGDTVTPEVQSAIDALTTQIDALKASVAEATS